MLAYRARNRVRLSITNTRMLIVANTAGSVGLMSNWKVTSFYYLKADSENEAWSMATLELPDSAQIIRLEEKGEENE